MKMNSPEFIEAINKHLSDPMVRLNEHMRQAQLRRTMDEITAMERRETEQLCNDIEAIIKSYKTS